MDRQNRRFEGEKNLSDKLKNFESGDDIIDLVEFDSRLNEAKMKSPLWMIFKYLGFFLIVGIAVVLMVNENPIAPDEEKISSELIIDKKNDTALPDDNNGGTKNKELAADITNRNLQANEIKVNEDANRLDHGAKKIENYSIEKDGSKEIAKKITNTVEAQRGNGANISSGWTRSANNSKYFKINESQRWNNSGELNNTSLGEGLTEINKPEEDFKTSILSFDFLPHLQFNLDTKKREFENLSIETEPIEIVSKPMKRISFGVQFNLGNTHAGAHETPFVSPEPTRIEGVKAFGYGLFGQINIDKRNSLRTSFTYNKIGHRQIIDSLHFRVGISSIILELYSHELKFGLDYGFNLLPNHKFLDFKAGFGIAYHKIINLESNNYYTDLELEIAKLNQLTTTPISYKLFLALEVPIYKDFAIGVEPYFIYQNRRARYTNSTFIADAGDYNTISGVNFNLRF